MTGRYERLATDGDAWGYAAGRWVCLTDSAITETDESLTVGYPPVEIYVPAPSPQSVTFDLSDPDARHALTQALEDYRDKAAALASRPESGGSFSRWAWIAEEMRAQAEAAGQ